MSDTELTDTEAARLRQLLHRAADSLEVTTPDADPVDLRPATQRHGRGRWLFAAAAGRGRGGRGRLVAVGRRRGPHRHRSRGADRHGRTPVLEQTGIWRLPEDLDGYRVVGAQDGGSFDSSSVDTPGVLAVDDPEDPQRWLLVQAYDELGELDELPAGTRQVELSDEVTVTLVPTSGSTWFRVAPTGDVSGYLPISGSALGIDEAELTELLAERFGTVGALAATADSTARWRRCSTMPASATTASSGRATATVDRAAATSRCRSASPAMTAPR